jgi:hypothetical protein
MRRPGGALMCNQGPSRAGDGRWRVPEPAPSASQALPWSRFREAGIAKGRISWAFIWKQWGRVDLSAKQIGQDGRIAAIGDVEYVNAGHEVEHHSGNVGRGSDAGRCHVDLAWPWRRR